MSKIDSIIFDLDGTLWSSAKAISEAWGLVLQKHENIEKKNLKPCAYKHLERVKA